MLLSITVPGVMMPSVTEKGGASPVKLARAETRERTVRYTVVKGDTLWAIARKFLGSGGRYPELAEKNGITVVIEVLNSTYNHKGYYLDSSYVGFEIVKAVQSPSIKLLFDCYHMQLMDM